MNIKPFTVMPNSRFSMPKFLQVFVAYENYVIKVNRYTFRGNNSSNFNFVSLSNGSQLLKGMNLLLWEQILSIKSRPILEVLNLPKRNREVII